MLKTIAILLNIILLCVFCYLFGTASGEIMVEDMMIFLFFIIFFIINLSALILGKDNWITLYFKRKALEEKTKIVEIENKEKK
ncbi:MAG: hypothetical protein WC320_01730 [Candidatus Paceibacterota bacterium]|jgi:amino acid transporter